MNPARSKTELHIAEAPTRGVRPAVALVPPPAPAVRARQLLHEARKASLQHLGALKVALATVHDLAEAVAGDEALYGPGLTSFAGQFAEELFWRAKNLELLTQRQRAQLESTQA